MNIAIQKADIPRRASFEALDKVVKSKLKYIDLIEK